LGGAGSTHGIHDKFIRFWSENLKAGDHSEDLDLDGKIMFK